MGFHIGFQQNVKSVSDKFDAKQGYSVFPETAIYIDLLKKYGARSGLYCGKI